MRLLGVNDTMWFETDWSAQRSILFRALQHCSFLIIFIVCMFMHLFNIIIYYFIINVPLIIITTNIFAQLQEISIFSKALCILETCKVRYVEPSVESSCCNVSPPGLTSCWLCKGKVWIRGAEQIQCSEDAFHINRTVQKGQHKPASKEMSPGGAWIGRSTGGKRKIQAIIIILKLDL